MEWTDQELEAKLNDEARSASREGNFFLSAFMIVVTIGVLYYML